MQTTARIWVAGLGKAKVVAVGAWHACAILDDTTMRCWGNNEKGELGAHLASASSTTPVKVGWPPHGEHSVTTLSGAVAVAAGDSHTCTVFANGEVWCWGDNYDKQLGDPSYAGSSSKSPVLVPGLWVQGLSGHPPQAVAVTAAGQFTCALLKDATVWCWVLNNHGQLGRGSKNNGGAPPAQVSGLGSVVSVSAGHDHACAAVSGGTVKCWGIKPYVGLGDAHNTEESSVPLQVAGLANVSAVAVGAMHACALITDGTVWCWGDDGMGQLGDGRQFNRGKAPAAVPNLDKVVSLSAGHFDTCAVRKDGSLWCWGFNDKGQLGHGNPSTNDSVGDTPARVNGL